MVIRTQIWNQQQETSWRSWTRAEAEAKVNPLTSRPAQASRTSFNGVKRSSFPYRGTWHLQEYLDFHTFSFSACQWASETKWEGRPKFIDHLVQLRCNDCCIIGLLFSHLFQYFLTIKQKFRRPLPKDKRRSQESLLSLFLTNPTH
jgi:hypothetical protein